MLSTTTIDRALEIQDQFQQSLPFRHAVVDGFLEPDVCERLLADFPTFDPEKARNEFGQIGAKAVNEQVSVIVRFTSNFAITSIPSLFSIA